MLVSSVTEQKIETNTLHKKEDLNVKNNKTLILVPDLTVPGGVANYYNSLQLNALNNISYFTVNKQESNSRVSTTFRVIKNYLYLDIMAELKYMNTL